MALTVNVPLSTWVIESNPDCRFSSGFENGCVWVRIDTRGQNVHRRLGLAKGARLYWGREYEYEVQELSALSWPLRYRVLAREGYYLDGRGERQHFVTTVNGLDSQRGVSHVLMRAAILLLVLGGVGYRLAAWLLEQLFHVQVSKSSLQRWVGEIAGQLPDGPTLVARLHQAKPITELSLDELFPRGTNACVLVVRDEHGRIVASEALDRQDEEAVKPFLQRLKDLGLPLKAFYVDGYKAYWNAIRAVFGDTVAIQYDYFHVIHNAWRILWKWAVSHRREVKARAKTVATAWYSKRLERLAGQLWENRYLLFKGEERLSRQEREKLQAMVEVDPKVGRLRHFLEGVRSVFRDSQSEQQAKEALFRLRVEAADLHSPAEFAKVTRFLNKHFEGMTTYLRHDGVRRNSLAETGMRTLRRLEQTHDGFRTEQGRQDFLRLYQAIKYLGWSVYQPTDSLQPRAPVG